MCAHCVYRVFCACTTQRMHVTNGVCVPLMNGMPCRHCNRQLLLNDIICIVCAAGAITAAAGLPSKYLSIRHCCCAHSPIKMGFKYTCRRRLGSLLGLGSAANNASKAPVIGQDIDRRNMKPNEN